jgi:hypothetical protein
MYFMTSECVRQRRVDVYTDIKISGSLMHRSEFASCCIVAVFK